MSKNLKRDPIKYIRDKAKANYPKGTECEICGTTENLDFHHYYTLTPLFNRWLKEKKITIKDEDHLLDLRDNFIDEHQKELYDDAVTICHDHHMQLHSIYGKDPSLGTAAKQKRWVGIQREKHGLSKLDS